MGNGSQVRLSGQIFPRRDLACGPAWFWGARA